MNIIAKTTMVTPIFSDMFTLSKSGAHVHHIRGHSTTTRTEFCHNWQPPLPLPRGTLLRGHFLYPERGQKQTFFDSLPPHFVQVVIEWPLIQLKMDDYP